MDYLWTFIFVISMLESSAGLFVRQPGEIRVCVFDDAPFPWHFDVNATAEVTQIFWMYMGTGATLLGWYKNTDSTHTYPLYTNRVRLLEGTNAGIVLKNVTESDTGNYKIEMSGPGERDIAHLRVYNHMELTPALQVDNRDVTSGLILDKRNVSRTTITFKSAFDLPTNITINVADKISVSCVETTLCSTVILLKEIPSLNFTVNYSVDYGICDRQRDVIYILKHPNEPWWKSIVISLCVLGIIAIILGIIAGVWILLRNKERKSPHTHLQTWQKKYVHNRCLFKPMKAITRWSSSVWDVQDDENNKRGDGVHPETKKALMQSDDACSDSKEEPAESGQEKQSPFVKIVNFVKNKLTRANPTVSGDMDETPGCQSDSGMVQRPPNDPQRDEPDGNSRVDINALGEASPTTSNSANNGSKKEHVAGRHHEAV